jgi:Family of unknown function (DUF5343)
MEPIEKKKAAPPYVAYKTLKNFLERFKQGLPSRIDRGLMGSMSGAAQSQVTTAMRYLGMISENGIPTLYLREYVSGQEEERKAALFKMLMASYPFLFDTDHDVNGGAFHISTGTSQLLRETMEANTSATGETLGRCIAFVKEAAQDAGFKVSPYITQKSARSSGGGRRRNVKKATPAPEPTAPNVPAAAHVPKAASFAAQSSLMLMGLFHRLPAPGNKWSHDERERWVQTLQNVLLLEYPES